MMITMPEVVLRSICLFYTISSGFFVDGVAAINLGTAPPSITTEESGASFIEMKKSALGLGQKESFDDMINALRAELKNKQTQVDIIQKKISREKNTELKADLELIEDRLMKENNDLAVKYHRALQDQHDAEDTNLIENYITFQEGTKSVQEDCISQSDAIKKRLQNRVQLKAEELQLKAEEQQLMKQLKLDRKYVQEEHQKFLQKQEQLKIEDLELEGQLKRLNTDQQYLQKQKHDAEDTNLIREDLISQKGAIQKRLNERTKRVQQKKEQQQQQDRN
jgi:hypothetical protein